MSWECSRGSLGLTRGSRIPRILQVEFVFMYVHVKRTLERWNMALGLFARGFLIFYLKGMRVMMFQPKGFYCIRMYVHTYVCVNMYV